MTAATELTRGDEDRMTSVVGTKRTSATRPTMSVSEAKADLAGGQPDF